MIGYDYRFCVKASLQVMKEQRNMICKDSASGKIQIYKGLHETDSKRRELFFQYYLIEWLEAHWNGMQKILSDHPEYTKDQKKEFTLFYAEYFKQMLDSWVTSGALSKLVIPELLKALKSSVQELIQFSDKWEQNSQKLKLLLIKHREQFEKVISQCDE